MRRKGLGLGLGKGYRNLIPIDSYIHSLNARGLKLRNPTVKVLSAKDYDRKFADDYAENEVGYATTKIKGNGDVDIFVKYEDDDFTRTGKLLHHELAELDIWEDLVNGGMNPDYAEEVAHNKNPVKIEGVDPEYKLDSYESDDKDFDINARNITGLYPTELTDEEILNQVYYDIPEIKREALRRTRSTELGIAIEKLKDRLGIID